MRLRNRLHIILRHVSFFWVFPRQRHYQKGENSNKREKKEKKKKEEKRTIHRNLKEKNAIHKKILLHTIIFTKF